jgi:hypothetical protein
MARATFPQASMGRDKRGPKREEPEGVRPEKVHAIFLPSN